jgi:SHS2 domain-containing protein
MKKYFELLEHTADLKMRVYGTDKKELFVHALIGMFQILEPLSKECTKKDGIVVCSSLPIERTIKEHGTDDHALLVHFLSKALSLSDTYNEAYMDATIERLTNSSIQATLKGVPITGFGFSEIKAVTYHDLSIVQADDGWQAEIVFDI